MILTLFPINFILFISNFKLSFRRVALDSPLLDFEWNKSIFHNKWRNKDTNILKGFLFKKFIGIHKNVSFLIQLNLYVIPKEKENSEQIVFITAFCY